MGVPPRKPRGAEAGVHPRMMIMMGKPRILSHCLCASVRVLRRRGVRMAGRCRWLRAPTWLALCVGNLRRRRARSKKGPCVLACRCVCSCSASSLTRLAQPLMKGGRSWLCSSTPGPAGSGVAVSIGGALQVRMMDPFRLYHVALVAKADVRAVNTHGVGGCLCLGDGGAQLGPCCAWQLCPG